MENRAVFFAGGLDPSEDLGLFEEVFQNAGEAITVFDEKGNYHAFNPAFLRLTGYSVEELLDAEFSAVLTLAPENEHSMIQERLQEVLLGQGPVRYERHFVKKDGTLVPASVTLVKLKKRPSWAKDRILAVVTDTSSIKAKTWMELTPERYLNQVLDLAKKSFETGEIVWEDKAYIAKDGTEIPIRHGYTHIYHPGFGKTLALCLTLPREGPLIPP
jgi:PAS domain S-box-containing protein